MPARVYSVPAISCRHCQHAIETEVAKVTGVTRVQVDIHARTVYVEGDGTDAGVRAAIDQAGYDVEGEPSVR